MTLREQAEALAAADALAAFRRKLEDTLFVGSGREAEWTRHICRLLYDDEMQYRRRLGTSEKGSGKR